MKYSFIIPVYNSEEYIVKCLNSIIIQNKNKSNFEIIVVDDGSADNTQKIVEELSKKHKNIIKYYKRKHEGVSSTRNYGIDKSCGEYIIFVDSDDLVYDKFLYRIDKVLKNKKYDVIKSKVKCVEDKKHDGRFKMPVFKNLEGMDALIKFIKTNNIFATPWSYVINREFLIKNNLYFREGRLHEDYGLIPVLLSKAEKVASLKFYGYKYIKRDNSVVTKSDELSEITRINDFIFHTYNLLSYFEYLENKKQKKIIYDYLLNRLDVKINGLTENVKKSMDIKLLNKIRRINEG